MENISLKIDMPVEEVTHDSVISVVQDLGFESLGGYGFLDPGYGKGARYIGNLLEFKNMRFTLIVNGDRAGKQCLELKCVNWKSNYVTLEDRPIEAVRINGERYFFRTKQDLVLWLKGKLMYEQARYSINAPGFKGSAIYYMDNEV